MTRTMVRRVLAGSILLGCAACFRSPRPYFGPPADPGGAARFVGCYQVSEKDEGENASWFLSLDSIAPEVGRPGSGRGVPGSMWARTSNQGRYSSYWWMIPGGFQVYVGDSLHGWRVELFPRGDGLAGRTYDFNDVRPGFRATDVVARRVPCTREAAPTGES